MSHRMTVLGSVVVVVGVVFAALVLVAGCQKEKPAAPSQPQSKVEAPAHEQAVASPVARQAAATEQTVCPVMGSPIDKSIFVEYQGKKVYFCCASCPAVFQADPAKYLAKLPQFAK